MSSCYIHGLHCTRHACSLSLYLSYITSLDFIIGGAAVPATLMFCPADLSHVVIIGHSNVQISIGDSAHDQKFQLVVMFGNFHWQLFVIAR